MTNANTLSKRLAALPYFRALTPTELDSLAAQATYRQMSAGEIIFHHGDQNRGLWLLEHGRVKVMRIHPDGREHILLLAGPGDSFNDIPALDRGPAAATVIALTDLAAWCIPGDVLRAAVASNPTLALDIIDVLSERARTLIDRIEDLALCSVTTRLARFLIKQHDSAQSNGHDLARTTIAAHLATTPETLSRSLRTLEGLGIVRADRTTITILRRDLLEVVAAG